MPTVEIPGMGTVAFPDDMSEADISKEAAKLYRKNQPSVARMSGMVAQGLNPALFGAAKMAAENLPTLGSVPGQTLGGLGGAALGALTGPAAPVAVPALGYAGKVGGGAAGGAAGQVALNALSGGPVGEFLGLDPAESLTQGAGQEAMIQGAGSAIGVPLGAGLGRLGGVITGKTAAHAAAKSEKLVREATATGLKFDSTALMGNMHTLAGEAGHVSEPMLKGVKKLAEGFLKVNRGNLTPARVHKIVQYADDIATPIHEQAAKARIGKMAPPGPRAQLRARFYKNVADQGRIMLRQTVPGYEASQAQVQGAIRARMLVPSVSEGPITPRLTNMGGATEIAGRVLAGPDALMKLGGRLEDPMIQFLLAQIPRVAARPFVAAANDQ